MGMTIDESIDWIKNTILDMRRAQICISDRLALETAIDTMRKYQKLQADYENRLKADIGAMLTDLRLGIEELDSRAGYDGNGITMFSTDYIRKKEVNELIQQKIDTLKEDNDGR